MANETQTPDAPSESPAATDAWRQALASRRTEITVDEGVPTTQAAPLEVDASRRNFLRASFWTGLGVTLGGGTALFLDFWYPRNVKGFGGPVAAAMSPITSVARFRSRTRPVSSGLRTSIHRTPPETAPVVPRACWRCGGSAPTSAALSPGRAMRKSRSPRRLVGTSALVTARPTRRPESVSLVRRLVRWTRWRSRSMTPETSRFRPAPSPPAASTIRSARSRTRCSPRRRSSCVDGRPAER